MAQYGDQLYNIKDKIDVLLNVRVEQDKRDAYAALAKLVAEVNKSLGFFIDASIDWEFTTHPNFTSRSLDDQQRSCGRYIKLTCRELCAQMTGKSDSVTFGSANFCTGYLN